MSSIINTLERPKKRSRFGCHNCKKSKIKCDEKKPSCSYCIRTNSQCDYTIKLTWGGRPYTKPKVLKNDYTNFTFSDAQVQETGTNLKRTTGRKRGPEFIVGTSVLDFKTPSTPVQVNKEDGMPQTVSQTPDMKQQTHKKQKPNSMLVNESNYPILASSADEYVPSDNTNGINSYPVNGSSQSPLNSLNSLGSLDFSQSHDLIPIQETVESQGFEISQENLDKLDSDLNYLCYPDINVGIETLSMALEDIATDSSFNLNNLGIINDVMLPISEHNDRSLQIENNSNDTSSDADSFSTDLMRIKSYLPKRSAQNSFLERISPSQSKARDFSSTPYNSSTLNDNSNIMSFENIPQSILPLPDILLQVPYYRELFHFYCDVTSDFFVPAPSHIYKENPFKTILPRMAINTPAIMTTMLAFAASNRANLFRQDLPKLVIDQLLARTCNELIVKLHDSKEAKSDSTLATVLMLSSYEVLFSVNLSRHRTHNLGAKQIVLAKGLNGKNSNEKRTIFFTNKSESDISFFLVRWFSYIDVMGSLSSTKNLQNYLTDLKDSDIDYDLVEDDLEYQENPFNCKKDIDHLLGFDIRLLPHLAKIGSLIKKAALLRFEDNSTHLESTSESSIPIEILTKALEVKERLMFCYEMGEKRRDKRIHILFESKDQDSPTDTIKQDSVLRATNKIFCYMGIISLYRRVLKLSTSSSLVQRLSLEVIDTFLDKIEPGSPAEICSLFGTFTAGCEILDPEKRNQIKERFSKLYQLGNINGLKGLDLMIQCWETGKHWWDLAIDNNIDFVML